MGYKTVTLRKEIEQRTHVQGAFNGKYFGIINYQRSFKNFEIYDITIYDGEISYLKNEKEHPAIINETVYNATISETQLTQKSFENVLVNLDYMIKDYDSIRIAIKEPKLEAVQIYDVVKDSDQTFGTLTCLVSGYLLETHIETSEIQVETCDGCSELLEDCICDETALVTSEKKIDYSIEEDQEVEEKFWKEYFRFLSKENIRRYRRSLTPFSFGCVSLFSLLIGILILISFGFPGILIGSLVVLFYAISTLTRIPPTLSLRWRRLLYTFLGLLFLGLLFNLFEPVYEDYRSGFDSHVKVIEPQTNENPKNVDYSDSPKSHIKTQAVEKSTLSIRNASLPSDIVNSVMDENLELQNEEANILTQQNTTSRTQELNNSTISKSDTQFEQPNKLIQEHDEKQQNVISQNRESKHAPETIPTNLTEVSNNSSQALDTSQNKVLKRPKKVNKAVEIMSSIIFYEGEVFICKGDFSKRYHLRLNCAGLSNCSTRIYQINIPVAERDGRTLCKLEE